MFPVVLLTAVTTILFLHVFILSGYTVTTLVLRAINFCAPLGFTKANNSQTKHMIYQTSCSYICGVFEVRGEGGGERDEWWVIARLVRHLWVVNDF